MKNFIQAHFKSLSFSLLMALMMVMFSLNSFDVPLKNSVCKNGIVSFELAHSLDRSEAIMNSWNLQAKINAGLSLGIDFLFLILYSTFIGLLIYHINYKLWFNRPFYKYGKIFIWLVFLAAFFDVIENISLIQLLNGQLSESWPKVAYISATIKFCLVTISILYLLINWLLWLYKKTFVLKDNHILK